MKIVSDRPRGTLKASKWLRVPVLLLPIELKNILEALPPLVITPMGGLVAKSECLLDQSQFLKRYSQVFDKVFQGEDPKGDELRCLNLRIAHPEEDLVAYEVQEEKYLLYELKPAIHVQALFLNYSPSDKQLRSKVLGGTSFFWGVEFAFPQIYQEPMSQKIEESWNKTETAKLFKRLQKGFRPLTTPAKFIISGETITSSYKISLGMKEKISKHPHLVKQGIQCI